MPGLPGDAVTALRSPGAMPLNTARGEVLAGEGRVPSSCLFPREHFSGAALTVSPTSVRGRCRPVPALGRQRPQGQTDGLADRTPASAEIGHSSQFYTHGPSPGTLFLSSPGHSPDACPVPTAPAHHPMAAAAGLRLSHTPGRPTDLGLTPSRQLPARSRGH